MTLIRKATPEAVNPVSKVKGPIRCHKCQLKCRDAEHYLSHKCSPTGAADGGGFSSLLSSMKEPG